MGNRATRRSIENSGEERTVSISKDSKTQGTTRRRRRKPKVQQRKKKIHEAFSDEQIAIFKDNFLNEEIMEQTKYIQSLTNKGSTQKQYWKKLTSRLENFDVPVYYVVGHSFIDVSLTKSTPSLESTDKHLKHIKNPSGRPFTAVSPRNPGDEVYILNLTPEGLAGALRVGIEDESHDHILKYSQNDLIKYFFSKDRGPIRVYLERDADTGIDANIGKKEAFNFNKHPSGYNMPGTPYLNKIISFHGDPLTLNGFGVFPTNKWIPDIILLNCLMNYIYRDKAKGWEHLLELFKDDLIGETEDEKYKKWVSMYTMLRDVFHDGNYEEYLKLAEGDEENGDDSEESGDDSEESGDDSEESGDDSEESGDDSEKKGGGGESKKITSESDSESDDGGEYTPSDDDGITELDYKSSTLCVFITEGFKIFNKTIKPVYHPWEDYEDNYNKLSLIKKLNIANHHDSDDDLIMYTSSRGQKTKIYKCTPEPLRNRLVKKYLSVNQSEKRDDALDHRKTAVSGPDRHIDISERHDTLLSDVIDDCGSGIYVNLSCSSLNLTIDNKSFDADDTFEKDKAHGDRRILDHPYWNAAQATLEKVIVLNSGSIDAWKATKKKINKGLKKNSPLLFSVPVSEDAPLHNTMREEKYAKGANGAAALFYSDSFRPRTHKMITRGAISFSESKKSDRDRSIQTARGSKRRQKQIEKAKRKINKMKKRALRKKMNKLLKKTLSENKKRRINTKTMKKILIMAEEERL